MLMPAVAESRAGFEKIKACCKVARENGLEWVWIDTCCIDKTSTAKLSEAINSMFRWYQKATVCYAYLADVHDEHEFASSRWFRRGWTLQELIAPKILQFFSHDWTLLGSRLDRQESLWAITGIDEHVLSTGDCSRVSIAQRMAWASGRETTRAEDRAYSLMGIFDVNMPLLYGEGSTKAFLRLQQEILRASDDQTIFAWGLPETQDIPMHTSSSTISPCSSREQWLGLLADSPERFSTKHVVFQIREVIQEQGAFAPISPVVSGSGIRIDLPILEKDGLKYGVLAATVASQKTAYIALHLIQYDTTHHARCGNIALIYHQDSRKSLAKTIIVKERQMERLSPPIGFRTIPINDHFLDLLSVYLLDDAYCLPPATFLPSEQTISFPTGQEGVHGAFFFKCSVNLGELCAPPFNKGICKTRVQHFAMVIGSDTKHWVTVVPILNIDPALADLEFMELLRIDPTLVRSCMTKSCLISMLNTGNVDILRQPGHHSRQDVSLALPWRTDKNYGSVQFGVLRMALRLKVAPVIYVDRVVCLFVKFSVSFNSFNRRQESEFRKMNSIKLDPEKPLPFYHRPELRQQAEKISFPQWTTNGWREKFQITSEAERI
ncbi:hypothetical protein F4825DRAFT_327318 [Nemania diffusa]|nr:hypothetical protein F4825DRAFT_327318 [Nemania diffusa]